MVITRHIEPDSAYFRYGITIQSTNDKIRLALYNWVKDRLGPYETNYIKTPGWSMVIYHFRTEIDAFLFYAYAEGIKNELLAN